MRGKPITAARKIELTPQVVSKALGSARSAPAGVGPPQRELNDYSVQGTSLAQCKNLRPLPKLSSWLAFRRCHHARDGQRLLEVRHREDPNIIHNDLCSSRWNTWQPDIRPRKDRPYSSGIPGSLSSPSTHKCRSRLHISQSILCSFQNPLQSFSGPAAWR